MGRVAVFVDAGYLFAQGSAALAATKEPTPRRTVALDERAAVRAITTFAEEKAAPNPLLRVYWYDATSSQFPTADHIRLAEIDNVKLRLGLLNSFGQQKGVDSLIIADLIELARNGAIHDAVVLSGDEDLRVGVQVIQTFGIRVHLLGITAIDGEHQSRLLVREADTVAAWNADVTRKFMSQREVTATASGRVAPAGEAPAIDQTDEVKLRVAVVAFCQTLEPSDIEDIETVFNASRQIPPTYDGRLLASCRTALGRDLLVPERRQLRSLLIETLRAAKT